MSVADFETARETMHTRLLSKWDTLHPDVSGTGRDVPIVWENQAWNPDTQFIASTMKGWVAPVVLPGESRAASILMNGPKRFRTPGIYTVRIYCPPGQGDQEAVRIADDVVSSLRGLTISGVRLLGASINHVGVEEGWYRLDVHTRFRYDTLLP